MCRGLSSRMASTSPKPSPSIKTPSAWRSFQVQRRVESLLQPRPGGVAGDQAEVRRHKYARGPAGTVPRGGDGEAHALRAAAAPLCGVGPGKIREHDGVRVVGRRGGHERLEPEAGRLRTE